MEAMRDLAGCRDDTSESITSGIPGEKEASDCVVSTPFLQFLEICCEYQIALTSEAKRTVVSRSGFKWRLRGAHTTAQGRAVPRWMGGSSVASSYCLDTADREGVMV